MTYRRRGRATTVDGVLLSGALIILGAHASAAPGTRSAHADGARADRGARSEVAAAANQPSQQDFIDTFPNEKGSSILGAGLATSLRSSRTKLNIALPGVIVIVELDEATKTYRSIGEFKPADVSALAFGSIPLTATLSVTQPRKNGKVVPISLVSDQTAVSVAKGKAFSYDNRGCDPAWERDFPAGIFIADGPVDATLSNVRVDGRPVDVGTSCTTRTPLQLHLIGESAQYGGNYGDALSGGELVQQRNTTKTRTANPISLWPGSRNMTVPPFSGCKGANGEEISPLITGLVSGPGSTLSVNQQAPVFTIPPLDKPTYCDGFGGCAAAPAHLPPPIPG